MCKPTGTVAFFNVARYDDGSIILGYPFETANAAEEGIIPGDHLGTLQVLFIDGKLAQAELAASAI